MRKLTVRRHPTFVNSVLALQVFAEDRQNGNESINGIPCRYLGDISSGSRAEFEIDDGEQMIFVLPLQNMKKKNHEFYLVPEGSEDIEISGKCYYNPFAGNPFRFDNNTEEAALSIRKRAGRQGILKNVIAIAVAMAVFSLITFLSVPRDKVFEAGEMSITLTDRFEAIDYYDFTAAFEKRDVLVTVYYEAVADYPNLEDYTLDKYAQEIRNLVEDAADAAVKHENSMTYIDYNYDAADGSGDRLYSRIYFFQTQKGFWQVEFVIWAEDYTELKYDIEQWAGSVRFNQ